MLEKYLHKLSNLRTDRGRERYPAYTLHRAPHEPLLLLSIMDLIETYFVPKIRPTLLAQEQINYEAYQYSYLKPIKKNQTLDHTI